MNPHKGDVPLDVGGKTYTLRYSHLALVKLENVLDKNLTQIMREISNSDEIRLGTVVAMLWAGLQKHHPGVSLDDAAEMIDEIDGGMTTTITVVGAAFEKAFGATPGTKGTNPRPEGVNGSGMISSSITPVTDMTQTVSGKSHPGN